MSADPRPCERYCPGCRQWLHHSRFRVVKRGCQGTVTTFRRLCRACEQRQRVETKNEDRPLAIIRRRAAERAKRAFVPTDFFWLNMNYRALVPVFRALCGAEGLCLSCGHPFEGERDIQIEHKSPPRHVHDWARLHARNLGFFCGNCNGPKTDKEYDRWLDEQEDARLANEAYRDAPAEELVIDFDPRRGYGRLFNLGSEGT